MIFDMKNQSNCVSGNIQDIFCFDHDNNISNIELLKIYFNSLNLPIILLNTNLETILKTDLSNLSDSYQSLLRKEITDNHTEYFSNSSEPLKTSISVSENIHLNVLSISINNRYLLLIHEIDIRDREIETILKDYELNMILPVFFMILKKNKIKYMNRYTSDLLQSENSDLFNKDFYTIINRENFLNSRKYINLSKEIINLNLSNGKNIYIDSIFEKTSYYNSDFVIVTGFNITDEINRHMELNRKNKEFQYIFNNYDKAFLWIDTESQKIINCNNSALSLLNTTKEDILNTDFLDIYADNMRLFYSQLFKKESLKKILTNFEVQIKTDDNEIKNVYLSTRILNFDKRLILQKEFIELTEDKKNLLNLVKVQKLESINFFASGITHNFNNIIAAISGNLQLAYIHAGKNEKIREKIKFLQSFSKKGELLIKNFLKFSKKYSEEKSLIELNSFIESYIRNLDNPKIILDKTTLKFSSLFDPGQFKNLLKILITEIIEEGESVDKITISIKEFYNIEDNTSEVRTGKYNIINVCYESSEKIITDFSNESALNYSILKSITSNFNGYIFHEKKNDHMGFFKIMIPSIINTDPNYHTAKTETVKKTRILLMDDEEMILTIAEELLCEMGYDVTTCINGEEAVDLYTKEFNSNSPYDIFITDLTVKNGMGGLRASELIRKLHKDAKIIVSSGYSNNEIMQNYGKYGFLDRINKPYNLEIMEDTLKRIVDYGNE